MRQGSRDGVIERSGEIRRERLDVEEERTRKG